MTVKELVAKLVEFDDDMEVCVEVPDRDVFSASAKGVTTERRNGEEINVCVITTEEV